MANYFITLKDGKVNEISEEVPKVGATYICWCTDICGKPPIPLEQYVEFRSYVEQRQCEYRMTCDQNFFKFYGEMLDGNYTEEVMKDKLRAEKQKVKDKIPKE